MTSTRDARAADPEAPAVAVELIRPRILAESSRINPKRGLQPPWFTCILVFFRLFSTYLSVIVFLMYCSQITNYIINLTFLGWNQWASNALSVHHDELKDVIHGSSASLGLFTPIFWLWGGLTLSSSVMLIYDVAFRPQFFGFVRTVVLPTLVLMPIGFVLNFPKRLYLRGFRRDGTHVLSRWTPTWVTFTPGDTRASFEEASDFISKTSLFAIGAQASAS